jgi:hypothetical protein
MLIHFAMHWPQASSTELWPFAVDQAIYIWNHLPDSDTKLIIIFKTFTFLVVQSMF